MENQIDHGETRGGYLPLWIGNPLFPGSETEIPVQSPSPIPKLAQAVSEFSGGLEVR